MHMYTACTAKLTMLELQIAKLNRFRIQIICYFMLKYSKRDGFTNS